MCTISDSISNSINTPTSPPKPATVPLLLCEPVVNYECVSPSVGGAVSVVTVNIGIINIYIIN